jgi:hypothetical protein
VPKNLLIISNTYFHTATWDACSWCATGTSRLRLVRSQIVLLRERHSVAIELHEIGKLANNA